jgi:tRNA-splicing ligase RtcB
MCISEIQNGKIKLWTQLDSVESQALDQLKNIANLPWVFKHVAVMPDVHFGKGATVGSVVAMKDALSPAAVGVDIGCGMGAMLTNLTAEDLPESLAELRSAIEAAVPVGFNGHDNIYTNKRIADLVSGYKDLRAPNVHDGKTEGRMLSQIGTLGGGNHFIELCLDSRNQVWIVLHSGSRNIGKTLAEYHIGIARGLVHNGSLPDKDLAVFLSGTKEMEAYRHDLMWAQDFAYVNRDTMKFIIYGVMQKFFPQIRQLDWITCHHNYVSEENHFGEDVVVTRKGAISARRGEMGIIPGSMGTKTYIVRGLGNPDSYTSASHGAGRVLSRGAAKRAFTVADLEEQTKGIECRKDAGVLDEIPAAYKDIDQVMENQKDLVQVTSTLHQLMCIKG